MDAGGNSGTLLLSTNEKETRDVSTVLQEADQIDLLFGGLFDGNHEFDLHCSSYGARFVVDQVQPIIERHYGVHLDGDPIAKQIEKLLKASPSAARFSRDLKPIPTDLVKKRLLAIAATTGFMRDCLQNPDIILDTETRGAFRDVSRYSTTDFDGVVEFLEQLALIGGFDYGQLMEMVVDSSAPSSEEPLRTTDDEPFKVHLTQKLENNQPAETTSFPYFLLAAGRSGTGVEFRCNYDSSISTDLSGEIPDDLDGIGDISPYRIQIRPAVGQRLPKVDLRAAVEVHRDRNTMRLVVQEPSHRANTMPIVIGRQSPFSEGHPTTTQMSLYLPNVTVGNLSDLYYLEAAAHAGKTVSIQLALKNGTVIADSSQNDSDPFNFKVGLSRKLADRLSAVDRDIPAPFFIGTQLIDRLEKSGELSQTIEQIRSELSESPPLESFALVMQNESAQTFREEFLTVRSGISFPPPVLGEEGRFTQAELDKMWNERSRRFAIAAKFREDSHALAKDFREWAEDATKPWPVAMAETNERIHQIKTKYFFIRGEIVDRFWYREAPNYIILRSATRRERLQTELNYWKDVGDNNRANLIEEKLDKLDPDEESEKIPFQGPMPNVSTQHGSGPSKPKRA